MQSVSTNHVVFNITFTATLPSNPMRLRVRYFDVCHVFNVPQFYHSAIPSDVTQPLIIR